MTIQRASNNPGSSGVTIGSNNELAFNAADGSITVSAPIINGAAPGAVTVAASGADVVTFSGNNAFTGNLTINSGTTATNTGAEAGSSTGLGNMTTSGRTVTVNSGATLALLAGNQIYTNGGTTAPATTIVLNGGLFTTGSPTSSGGFWNVIGALTLNGGTVDVGTGTTNSVFQGLALSGTVTVGGCAPSVIQNFSGALAGESGVELGLASTNITFNVVATGGTGADLTVSAPLINSANTSAASGLIKIGTGTMALTATNTYTGATTISAGTLQLGTGASGNDGTIGSTSGVSIAGGATLAFDRFGASTASYVISGAGGIVINGLGTQTLSGNNTYTGSTFVNSGTLSLAGVLGGGGGGTAITNASTFTETSTGFVTGASSITNTSGTTTLVGINNYTGPTTINGGTLVLNGVLTGQGAVAVNSGATLTGTGMSSGPVTVASGGTLAPGSAGSGTFNLNGTTLSLSGACAMEINASTGASSAVQGISTVTYGGTLTVSNTAGTLAAGATFTLFNASAYSGAFSSISLPALPSNLQWDTSNLDLNGTITVTYTPWGLWQSLHFTTAQLNNAAISGPTAAPAGDGISNLMKYALNLNPMTCGAGGLPVMGVVTINGSNYLTLTYTQVISATDITYTPEVSGNLQTWNSGSGSIATVSVTNNPGGVTRTVVVRDLTPMTPGGGQFIQLKVTQE